MPELPEVETVRRGLAAAMEGRRLTRVVINRRDLRFPLPIGFAKAIEGRTVKHVGRRAKYLLIELDDGTVVLVHLGMSGRMVIDPEPGGDPAAPRDKHEHVAFLCGNGTAIRFSDARRFGMMDLASTATLAGHRLLRHLGPEPLDPAFDGPALAARLKGKHTPIKAALLDQRVVAGLGNIYACEALFRAGLSPKRSARTVQGARAAKLAAAIHAVLEDAIAAGGSTLRDHVGATGEIGYFQHSWRVYGHEGEPCPGCGRPIRRLVQSGRSTFYCPTCQR